MVKRNHHFVPKFYLDAFHSEVRRIHLYNLKSASPIKNASLKDQCYRHKFYGSGDQMEDFLASLENQLAPVLKTVVSSGTLPPIGSQGHACLLLFAAMQMVRTPKQANRLNRITDTVIKQIYSNTANNFDVDIDSVRISLSDPVLLSLENLPTVYSFITDLNVHLIVASQPTFVTSDNPAFKYNQYCETVQHEGVTGADQKGLQMFMPLSPRHQLVLYDGSTYRATVGRSSRTSRAKQSDIAQFNQLQLISADENVYFADWGQSQEIDRLYQEAKTVRVDDAAVVVEYGQDDDPKVSLIHQFERIENMSLNLSFLGVKESASQIPVAERPNHYRHQLRTTMQSGTGEGVRTFSRFIGRR